MQAKVLRSTVSNILNITDGEGSAADVVVGTPTVRRPVKLYAFDSLLGIST